MPPPVGAAVSTLIEPALAYVATLPALSVTRYWYWKHPSVLSA